MIQKEKKYLFFLNIIIVIVEEFMKEKNMKRFGKPDMKQDD
jgi:hypothetical protein